MQKTHESYFFGIESPIEIKCDEYFDR